MSDTPIMPPIAGALPDTEKQMFNIAATQGPLAGLDGAPPPAPKWFEEVVAIKPESRFVEVSGAKIH
jgi:hypothetical protein